MQEPRKSGIDKGIRLLALISVGYTIIHKERFFLGMTTKTLKNVYKYMDIIIYVT